jgi:hypothetical protein
MNAHLAQDWAPQRVGSGGHKLIRLPIPELYDVATDPKETENLFRQKTGLQTASENAGRDLGGKRSCRRGASDQETIQKLRALGISPRP